ncbi:A/G-specific adenine glycosylase [Breznakia pachnodae]|uniref:Adenine DNA glycosylase n=1 Tax=Breznakia pachnodae TaxID=265178 RepID=A0ABU0E710_9FIRM|nr:A/G-specific adenine glycosylase [Breznakia pachnodae]MDQ0362595.1 A/G-specific adenine glycosylase [Breznakia pachnodae]
MRINIENFRNDLLNWYDEYARVLPWRSEPLPYYVWVSEIMLQQTRVEAVKPYFARFIKRLPTLKDLAEVDDDELRKLWEGLGYYNRVRNMKKCAIECMDKYNGFLPSAYEELIELPGIGSYTAGAIASIAYKEVVPAVDGNVLRVFSRLLASYDDIGKESTKKKFHTIIQEYVSKDRPDAFNQAVMEIGAMVCVPNSAPRCNICPIVSYCQAYETGKEHVLPIKEKKLKRRIEKRTIVVMVHDGKVVLRKRPQTGLLADLYEFINLEGYHTKKQLKELFNDSYTIKSIEKLPTSKHIFSHVEWHMHGYLIEVENVNDELLASITDVDERYAIPTAFKAYKDMLKHYIK